MKSDDAFLLHPKNRAFLDGKKRLPVGLARPGMWVTGGLALLLFVGGLVVLGKGMWEERKIDRLKVHGVKTLAIVVNLHETTGPGDSRDPDT